MTTKPRPTMKFARPSQAQKASAPDAGEMRLNVSLPAELHWRIRARAAEKRQTLRAYILSLVEQDGVDLGLE